MVIKSKAFGLGVGTMIVGVEGGVVSFGVNPALMVALSQSPPYRSGFPSDLQWRQPAEQPGQGRVELKRRQSASWLFLSHKVGTVQVKRMSVGGQ